MTEAVLENPDLFDLTMSDQAQPLLDAVKKHIKENADSYREQIASNAKFIVSILNDIHFRLNKFFTSCAKAQSIEDISFNYICFQRYQQSCNLIMTRVKPGEIQQSLA